MNLHAPSTACLERTEEVCRRRSLGLEAIISGDDNNKNWWWQRDARPDDQDGTRNGPEEMDGKFWFRMVVGGVRRLSIGIFIMKCPDQSKSVHSCQLFQHHPSPPVCPSSPCVRQFLVVFKQTLQFHSKCLSRCVRQKKKKRTFVSVQSAKYEIVNLRERLPNKSILDYLPLP